MISLKFKKEIIKGKCLNEMKIPPKGQLIGLEAIRGFHRGERETVGCSLSIGWPKLKEFKIIMCYLIL